MTATPPDGDWIGPISRSFREQFGVDLQGGADLDAPGVVVLCHDVSEDPRFVFANRAAQELWERPASSFVGLPSRLSAPPDARAHRADALVGNVVTTGYAGERISATGRRFVIRDAVLWPVSSESGSILGQAATFSSWTPLSRDLLEILATDLSTVRAAVARGADRIELCVDYHAGGTTPPVELIREAVAATREASVGVMVMIRPRGGDFVYSREEIHTMERSVDAAVAAGASGLVWGCLTPGGNIDTVVARRLLARAPGVPVTFHRAVDASRDPVEAAREAFALGCSRVLTSGGAPTAPDGLDVIRQMVAEAPAHARVMAGSGVRRSNAAAIREATGVLELHASSAWFDG